MTHEEWVKETCGLLSDFEAEADKLAIKKNALEVELSALDAKIRGAKLLIEAYKLKHSS